MRNTDAIKKQTLDDPTGRIYYRKIDLFHEAVGTVILLLIVFCMFCSVFWLGSHYAKPIRGASMQPTINNYADPTGDIAIVSSASTYSYGDVIIVDMERSQNTDYLVAHKLLIKRVLAFPGDSIRIVRDTDSTYHFELKKSGESEFVTLDEPYINQMTSVSKANAFISQSGWTVHVPINEDNSITIPAGYYFFAGDNRDASYDCRAFGPVEMDTCIGVVESILTPDNFWNRLFSLISSIFNVQHTEAIEG